MQTSPSLLFNDNCAEAMRFYQTCLGGDLTLTRLQDTPMKEQFPLEKYSSSYDEPKLVFDKLCAGAHKNAGTYMDLRDMPLGIYGQFTDKFKVPWILKATSRS